MMISMLRYKAERAGGWFAIIDPRNTSQDRFRMRPHGPKGPVGASPKDEAGRSEFVERLCATDQRPAGRRSGNQRAKVAA